MSRRRSGGRVGGVALLALSLKTFFGAKQISLSALVSLVVFIYSGYRIIQHLVDYQDWSMLWLILFGISFVILIILHILTLYSFGIQSSTLYEIYKEHSFGFGLPSVGSPGSQSLATARRGLVLKFTHPLTTLPSFVSFRTATGQIDSRKLFELKEDLNVRLAKSSVPKGYAFDVEDLVRGVVTVRLVPEDDPSLIYSDRFMKLLNVIKQEGDINFNDYRSIYIGPKGGIDGRDAMRFRLSKNLHSSNLRRIEQLVEQTMQETVIASIDGSDVLLQVVDKTKKQQDEDDLLWVDRAWTDITRKVSGISYRTDEVVKEGYTYHIRVRNAPRDEEMQVILPKFSELASQRWGGNWSVIDQILMQGELILAPTGLQFKEDDNNSSYTNNPTYTTEQVDPYNY